MENRRPPKISAAISGPRIPPYGGNRYLSSQIHYLIGVGCVLLTGLVTGCVGVKQPEATHAADAASHASVPLEQLQQMEDGARTRREIEQVLAGYQHVHTQNEAYQEVQTSTARLYLLLGAAHALNRTEQREFYQLAQKSAERALRQIPAFDAAIASGQSVAAAAHGLPVEDYEPLFLWVTSVFYTFRDVAGFAERIFGRNRLQEAAGILEDMIRRSPDWQDGALQFSLGIYYLSVPQFMGGDRDTARQLMDVAVSMGDQRLLPRWGRGKYLAAKLRDWELYRSDLEWVASRDLSDMRGPAIWNAYFQQDARRLLESVRN